MPRHQGAEAEVEVEILVSVDVVDAAAFSIADKKRIRIVSAIIARHTERQTGFGAFMRVFRTRRALLVDFDFFLETCVHNNLRTLFLWPTHGPEI